MDVPTPERPPLALAALNRLLRPTSIAIIGASPTLGSLGASVLGNLERMGFGGAIHLVNPKHAEIAGRPCLASARALPFGVDCAVLAVPRAAVLESVRDCAARGIGGVIIYAVGFAEEGPEGLAQQLEIARIADESGMVVEGPNCLGLVNYIDGAPLTFVEVPGRHLNGRGVAIISQSGAIAAILSISLHDRNVPLTFTVSTGNEAVSGVEDFLEYMVADEQTSAITIIAEHFRDPPRLLALARLAANAGKPIVLLHPGRSNEARTSAATHTGAMVGDYEVMRVLTESAGLILVESLAEALDVTELVARCGDNFGKGLMLLTESGAFKALALDQCGEYGLVLPSLSGTTATCLSASIPDFIPATNPLDLTAQALIDPAIYQRALAAVLGDTAFGVAMFAIILSDEITSARKLSAIIEAIKTLNPVKPIIVAGLDEGAATPQALVVQLRELSVPFFTSSERVFTALARLQRRQHPKSAAQCIGAPAMNLPAGVIPEYRAKLLLQKLGISIPPGRLAKTVEEGVNIAEEIGYPVVLKVQSREISHKSDVGGVVLNLATPDALRGGWMRLHENLHRHCPEAQLDGVLVEAMCKRGTELIIGARRDPDWGLVLLAGFGGIMAEALHDVQLLSPGMDKAAVITALQKLKSAAILNGFRGSPALDVGGAADIIIKLDSFLQAHPEINEVDINPVILYPAGEGALAVDALMQVE